MPWLNDKELAERDKKAKDELEAKLKADHETALKAHKTDTDKKIGDLEAMVKKLEAKPPVAAPLPNNQEPPKVISFEDNPEGALAQRLTPMADLLVDTRAMLLKKDILESKKFYKVPKIKQEVDALLARQPLSARANPEVIENCYNTVLGTYHTEISTADKGSEFFLETGSNANHTPILDKPKTGIEALSDEQKSVARRMGIKPEAYAKQLSEMEMVG